MGAVVVVLARRAVFERGAVLRILAVLARDTNLGNVCG
jgi:hypothetical protein